MRQPTKHNRRNAPGFSIIELMVSISIIALLVAITFPFLSALTGGSRVEAGMNIAGMSADVARQWVQFESWANDGSTAAPTNESYSGTAALYCPTGEIRIVSNFRNADDAGSYLEDMDPEVNGYSDMGQVDYIRVPRGAGIVGIRRTGAAADAVEFIAPPFAIAFNELGQLSHGDADGNIYYDADGDNDYTMADDRPAGYDPSEWDGTEASPNYDDTKVSQDLPFEAIECVPGLVVYDANAYVDAGFDFAGGGSVDLTDPAGQWLNENGRTIFFSPHTGVALRDEQE